MKRFEKDICYTHELLNGKKSNDYSSVFYSSNERFAEILSDFLISNKSILSVAGSGDQAFYLYGLGASKVDLFDVNILSFYYFYLRLWTMIYLKKSYPDYFLNIKYIRDLLSIVVPSTHDEIEAYSYWNLFCNCFDDKCFDALFVRSFLDVNSELFDEMNIYDRIIDWKPKFYHMNIIGKNKVKAKYDILYTSNIPEYLCDCDDMEKYKKNIYKILNKTGTMIASNLLFSKPKDELKEVFSDKFEYFQLPVKNDNCLGFCFSKKRGIKE